MTGTQFKNQVTRMVLSLGYRVTKELANPEGDGVNLLCSSKEDVNQRALFRVRKWKDAKVSDVFIRDMVQQMEEAGASKGCIVGNFEVTEGGKKMIASSANSMEIITGDKFEELLDRTM